MACPLASEKVWTDKGKYDDAEKQHFEKLSKPRNHSGKHGKKCNPSSNVEEIPSPLSKTHKSAKNAAIVQSNDIVSKPESVQEVIPKSCCHIPRPDDIKPNEPVPIKSESQKSPPRNKSKKNRKNKNANIIAESNIQNISHNIKNESGDSKPSEAVNIKEAAGIMFSNLPASPPSNPIETDEVNTVEKVKSQVVKAKKDKEKRNKADKKSHERIDGRSVKVEVQGSNPSQSSLAGEVAKARQHIKNSLECMDGIAALAAAPNAELLNRLTTLEKEGQTMKKEIEDLKKIVAQLTSRTESAGACPKPTIAVCPAKPAPKKVEEDDDDGVDLFASDSEGEDDAAAKVREERLAAYAAKKSKKPVLIAKSNIILDVKPWDDETDMKAMEVEVRKIKTDGLLWGAAKLVPLAYGIHKLQISCVVEDDKVSIDWLQEELEQIEDFVQSIDIAAFNKV